MKDVEQHRNGTYQKYIAVQVAFKKLYEEQRLRYDDAIEKLAKDFYISKVTVQRILRTDMKIMEEKLPSDLNQLNMFPDE